MVTQRGSDAGGSGQPHDGDHEVAQQAGHEGGPAAADRDRVRAAHADREQVIEALKDAFVQGRLTRDELDAGFPS